MGRRSWIHLIICNEDYKQLIQFIEKEDYKYEYFIVGFALINGRIQLDEHLGGAFGEENKKSLVILTQSDGSWIIDELESNGIIEDVYRVLLLDNLDPSELVHSSHGARIKKASYLTQEEFLEHLENLEINEEYNNPTHQKELEIKSTGALLFRYVCKIIVGIYSYLNDNYNKEIDRLFSDTTELFNALGSWVYVGRNPKIVYPYLRSFLDNANNIKIDSFSYLVDYINYVGEDLLDLLKKHQLIEHDFYDTFTIQPSKDKMTGVLLMWRLGKLIINIIETSKSKDVPILLQSFRAFDGMIEVFGKWVFADYKINKISESLEKFEEALEYKQNEIFINIIEEAKVIYEDISKFLNECLQNEDDKDHQLLFKEINCFKGKEDFYPYGFHPNILVSSDNKTLYTTTADKSIKELDIKTGKIKATIIPSNSHYENIVSFAISSDNQFILTCAFGDPLKLWDKNSGKLIRELNHEDELLTVAFSSDNKFIIACGEGYMIYIWNVSTGEKENEIEFNGYNIAISQDNQYIVGANMNNDIMMYKVEDGRLLGKFTGHESDIVYVNFTPDCTEILSVSDDNTVKLWDVETGFMIREFNIYDSDLQKGDNYITNAVLSPDGKYVSVPTDDYLKIWDITTGTLIQLLPFRLTYITGNARFSLAHSQDGTYLAMSDGDMIYIWKKINNESEDTNL